MLPHNTQRLLTMYRRLPSGRPAHRPRRRWQSIPLRWSTAGKMQWRGWTIMPWTAWIPFATASTLTTASARSIGPSWPRRWRRITRTRRTSNCRTMPPPGRRAPRATKERRTRRRSAAAASNPFRTTKAPATVDRARALPFRTAPSPARSSPRPYGASSSTAWYRPTGTSPSPASPPRWTYCPRSTPLPPPKPATAPSRICSTDRGDPSPGRPIRDASARTTRGTSSTPWEKCPSICSSPEI
mmetsp:Transcript_61920/g.182913  ORF Transcript_61920/g.182913 Transcript_61920/m.182913 type:complete len:242 (+) Transcript_61920:496-1221(+)